jgi:hypothetical protein
MVSDRQHPYQSPMVLEKAPDTPLHEHTARANTRRDDKTVVSPKAIDLHSFAHCTAALLLQANPAASVQTLFSSN